MSQNSDRGAQSLATPLLVVLVFLALRLYWAWAIPLGNDEAYYWDWGRNLSLSFLDHPPGVAYLAWLGQKIAGGALGARLLVPFLQLLAVFCLFQTMKLLKEAELSKSEVLRLVLLTQFVPAFSLGGFFLLPDAGLMTALSAILWYSVYLAKVKGPLGFRHALVLGLLMGFSGLFKYHAAPTVAGMALGLWILRRETRRIEARFWFIAIAMGALVTGPVWIWNANHHWASFRFQGEHGFAGAGWNFSAALRFIFGQLIFLSPIAAYWLLSFCSRTMQSWRHRQEPRLILALGFMPLFCLLMVLCFFKELLPHWILPAYWLLVPGAALIPFKVSRLTALNWGFFAALTIGVPTFMSLPAGREALLKSLSYKPAGVGELTLWPSVANQMRLHMSALVDENDLNQNPACPKPFLLAANRWYWVAHLAFEMPEFEKVISLDMERPSYYSQRDDLRLYDGCAVLVIGDENQVDSPSNKDLVEVTKSATLFVADHLDIHPKVLFGRLTSKKAAEKYPLLRGNLGTHD